MRHSLCLLLLTGLIAGCSKKEPSGATTTAATTSSKPSAPEVTADVIKGATPATPPPGNLMSIPQRFESEAQHRPTHAVRAEAVVGALKKVGLPVTKPAQHLAAPFLAAYCLGIKVGESDMSGVRIQRRRHRDEGARGLAQIVRYWRARDFPQRADHPHGALAAERRGDPHAPTAVNAFMALKPE